MARSLVFVGAVLLVLSSWPLLGAALSPQGNPQRERRIEQQLQSIAPEAVPDFTAATAAMAQRNHAEAARLFRQVLQRAPRFSPALRRLGLTLYASGQQQAGRDAIDQAIAIERSPENLISLVTILTEPVNGQEPSQIAREYALRIAQEASQKAHAEHDLSYPVATAEIALSLQRERDFRASVNDLMARFPEEMPTHYFAAILAALDGEWIRAEHEIREAQRLGLAANAAAEFLDGGVHQRAVRQRVIRYTALAFSVWLAGLLLLFVAGKVLSRRTLSSIERTDVTSEPSAVERSLRKMYRRLIAIAASYYYVSVPFVIVSVLAFAFLVLYVFSLVGWTPLGLIATLLGGAVVTVIKSVQSIFVRARAELPGRSLDPAEAPELFRLAREVAAALGTRPIDEIRVTPGIEMGVLEHGTRRARNEDRARRVLLLGVGLLEGFRQAPFCAVLAHEYGHFAHRDTMGGELALRVQNDMTKFALALVKARQNTRLNVAWHFLRAYAFLFRRISHGATRLQEVLADRVAAVQFGARNFEDGLRHVVRRHIEFMATLNAEVQAAIEARRPLRNVYTLAVPRSEDLEWHVHDAMTRPTTEDDTHPGPQERFERLRGVNGAREWSADGFVWDLFVDRDGLSDEMSRHVTVRFVGMPGPTAEPATT